MPHDGDGDRDACSCKPANATKITTSGASITGSSLLAMLRRHAKYVAEQRPGRDTKLLDDELRSALANFCTPCGVWIDDRARIDTLFPLDRLDEATAATCLGLVLRNGTTAWSDARPPACR